MNSLPEAVKECLTCSICFEVYTEPQTLPCLHTFCKSCLKSFIERCNSDDSCACPLCRKQFLRSGEHVKTNFDIQKMIDSGKFSTSSQQIFCSFCTLKDRNELAVSQCVTCLDFLCKACSESRHKFTRQTLNHKIVPLSDIKKGNYDKEIRLLQMMRCSKHRNEILRMHCIPCNSFVCSECVLLEHNQHKLQTIPNARKESECEIQKFLEALKKRHESISNSKTNLSMKMKDISEKKRLLQTQIDKTCTQAIRNIREIQTKSSKELEEVFDPPQVVVQTSFKDCSDLCVHIEEFVHKSELDLANANDIEAIHMCDEIKQRACQLKKECDARDFTCSFVKIPDLHITWNDPNMRIRLGDGPEITNATITTKRDAGEADEGSRKSILSKIKDNPSVLNCAPKLKRYYVNLIEKLTLREFTDSKKPVFTSVTWIDKENIAAIDQANEKIKVFHLTNGTCMSRIMPLVLTVSACEIGIACKSGNDCMKVFKIPFMEIKKESNVACVISSVLNNSNLKWITKQDVFSCSEDTLSKISIKNRKNFSLPERPKHAFCCVNGTLIVSDKTNHCVFFINTDGEIMKQIDHYPGSIAQNNKEHIFITDSEQGAITVLDYTGQLHCTIKIGTWRNVPKCISILDDKLLVATQHRIKVFEIRMR